MMATEGEVSNNSSTQNGYSFEVITLSSDEEDDNESSDDSKYSFDRFILACRQHIAKEALAVARDVFKAAPKDLICSKEITEMLKRNTKLVNKDNASRFMNEICERLKNGKVAKQSTASNNNNLHARSTCCASDVTNARDFKEIKGETTGNGVEDIAEVSDDDDVDFVCEVHTERPADLPSTSSAHHNNHNDELKFPKTGKMATKDLTSRQKKRLGMKLKRRLKEISQEIKILNKSELTLDEMEMADSNYIKENRLKKKFDKTWNKLCKILGRAPNTGRVIEKSIRPSSTGYTIIDKAIEKFMEDKHGKFPDYFDIRDVVLKTNEMHDLRMSPQVLKGIIADVFTDIGNKLQRLREKDLVFNFGSHLLDDFKTKEDPALANGELLRKLERNRKISKKKLKQVYAKYTHLERYEKQGTTAADPDVQQDDGIDSDNTTTDDEEESNKTVTGITSMSDEEDSNPTLSSPPKNGNHPTNNIDDDLDNATKTTVQYVSLVVDGTDSMDGVEPSTVLSDNSATTCTKPNIQTESCAETALEKSNDSSLHLNDDCCIIDKPVENSSSSVNQTQTSPLTLEKPCLSNIVNHPNPNHVRMSEINSKKRKSLAQSRVEELVSALKRRKLKVPGSLAEETSPVAMSEEYSGETLLGTTCVNGGSPPAPIAKQLHTEQNQDRESTSNDVSRLSTSKVQTNTTVNHSFESKPDITSSFQQSIGGRKNFPRLTNNGHTKTTVNQSPPVVSSSTNSSGEKNRVIHDVIIIDD